MFRGYGRLPSGHDLFCLGIRKEGLRKKFFIRRKTGKSCQNENKVVSWAYIMWIYQESRILM
ncbi:MAG: hypothetical protein HPY66_1169 [Firmicutes bacterium]|nr:hypothetical protein [Bacillota bacterium]